MKYSFVPFREENFERIDLSIRNYVYRALSSSSFRSTSQYVRTKFQLRYFSQTYGTLPRSVSLSSTRFPYRQGKLCYHTCYRSTLERYWRKKSVSARNARRGKAAFPSFLRPRQTGDDEFIENRLVLSRATVFFFFHRVQNVIGYINQRWIDTIVRSNVCFVDGRHLRISEHRWFPISFERGSLSRLAPHRFPRW